MHDDPFAVLQIPPTTDGRAIERAYWIRSRELAAARATDLEASRELERLNRAYHGLTSRDFALPRPPTSRRRRRPWRLVGAALVAAVAVGAAVVGFAFRGEIADLGRESGQLARQFSDDTRTWLDSIDATPVPEVQTFVIYSTGGQGANLRAEPSYRGVGIVAHPEGTPLTALGEERLVEGETWLRLRDSQGREGWISSRWLKPLAEPPPAATR